MTRDLCLKQYAHGSYLHRQPKDVSKPEPSGFHIGNHNMNPNKLFPYEEDIRVPFLIRGPNIPKGKVGPGFGLA